MAACMARYDDEEDGKIYRLETGDMLGVLYLTSQKPGEPKEVVTHFERGFGGWFKREFALAFKAVYGFREPESSAFSGVS